VKRHERVEFPTNTCTFNIPDVFIDLLLVQFTANNFLFVGFEVLTAVVMKNTVFWDITPRLPTCFHAGILLGLFFEPEDGGYMFLRNVM
jgi:hypothetical protein